LSLTTRTPSSPTVDYVDRRFFGQARDDRS
jgi:hypothetical protein